jgi:uncharacterized protein (TIGR03437 family)
VLLLSCAACSQAQVISTVAGTGTATFTGDTGLANVAGVNSPYGVAADNAGNLYIADYGNDRIRKINSSGVITTIAGCGEVTSTCIQTGTGDGGPATATLTTGPWDVVADNAGNVYFTDSGTNRVRKVDSSGTITTVAGGGSQGLVEGGVAVNTQLGNPVGLAIDSNGNLYLTDVLTNRVLKVTPSGIITTVAGNGGKGSSGDGLPATGAALNSPHGVAVDSAGNVYIADTANARVRKVNTAGVISTIAGNGQAGLPTNGAAAVSSSLSAPWGVKVDANGNVFISDPPNIRVFEVSASGTITTLAGTGTAGFAGDGGPPASALLENPTGLAVDAAGDLYIADAMGNRVRKISAATAVPPAISAIGMLSGSSLQSGIVPGAWATIQGTSLSSAVDTWGNSIVNGKLPSALDGVSVSIGTKPAYVGYVSPTQLNFVVPDLQPGPVQVTVTTSAGTSAAFTVTAQTYGPMFFLWPGNQAVATRTDFSLAAKSGTFTTASSVAAKPGDTIILWGTGFGPTVPNAPTGFVVPSSATYSTSTTPYVTINGIPALVYGAALAPGLAGLYQVAIQVPMSLGDGDWAVQVTMAEAPSPAGVILSVQH